MLWVWGIQTQRSVGALNPRSSGEQEFPACGRKLTSLQILAQRVAAIGINLPVLASPQS